MITLKNISKSFGGRPVLDGFSLEIKDGAFLAIVGKSGSGKTTLLNIIGLLEKPDTGVVSIDGKSNMGGRDTLLFHRHSAGFLFQNFALIDSETVEKNLRIAATYRGSSDRSNLIDDALKAVGLDGMKKRKVFELSGGEQQRVALARILVKDAKYIFADEPTGNLDVQNRDIIFSILREQNKRGKTVIFVTHDLVLAKSSNEIIEIMSRAETDR